MLYHEVAVALQAQPLAAHFDKTWGAHIGVKAGETAAPLCSRAWLMSACLVRFHLVPRPAYRIHGVAFGHGESGPSLYELVTLLAAHADRRAVRRQSCAPRIPARCCLYRYLGHLYLRSHWSVRSYSIAAVLRLVLSQASLPCPEQSFSRPGLQVQAHMT